MWCEISAPHVPPKAQQKQTTAMKTNQTNKNNKKNLLLLQLVKLLEKQLGDDDIK